MRSRWLILLGFLNAASLGAQERSPADSALARTGFYERMHGTRGAASSAEFVSPEELRGRAALKFSHLLVGRVGLQVGHINGRALVAGRRRGCSVAFLVDGLLLRGTINPAQIFLLPQAPYEFSWVSIDELVDPSIVVAIEIYATGMGLPLELQRYITERACPVVAIWTGAPRP